MRCRHVDMKHARSRFGIKGSFCSDRPTGLYSSSSFTIFPVGHRSSGHTHITEMPLGEYLILQQHVVHAHQPQRISTVRDPFHRRE